MTIRSRLHARPGPVSRLHTQELPNRVPLSAPLPIPSSPRLSLEELKAHLAARPTAILLGPGIASALSGRSVVLKDLLQSGLRLAFDNIGINEKLKQQVLPSLDNFDLLRRMRVGSLLESFAKTKKGLLADWLREAIGPPVVANPAVAAPLLRAAQSGFALASATYDGLLEMASGLKSMTWLEFHGLSQLLTPPTLLRLYGTWDQPESIVRALPGASGAELHQRAIDTLLNDLQLVVTLGAAVPLGEDPLVEGLKRRGEGLPGVVVCRDDEVETAQAFLAEHLPWFRIAPYSGGNDALPDVLISLFGAAPLPGTPVLESTTAAALSAPRAPRILVQDAGSAVLDLAYFSFLDQDALVSGQANGSVKVWGSSGNLTEDRRLATSARTWAVSGHPRYPVIAYGDENGSLDWLDLSYSIAASGEPDRGNSLWAVAFDPYGHRLACARDSGHIEIWEAPETPESRERSQNHLHRLSLEHAHAQGALAVAFSPDGQTLASAGHDKAIRFWSVPDLKPLRVLEGHDDWVGSIAYSPDGKTLASTGGDKIVILWDLETGKPLWRSGGHTEWVQSLSFHPSGELIATGSWDKTVRVWNASNGQWLRTFEGHTERVWTVAFSPDGTWLASGGDDRTIRLWPIDVAELKAGTPSAQGGLPREFRDLARDSERFARFLARLTLRHREGLSLLESLEPGRLADALRPANVLAASSPKDFAERTLDLEKGLDPSFEPPPLWLAWMQHVRRTELARLGQELVALAERTAATPAPALPIPPPTRESAEAVSSQGELLANVAQTVLEQIKTRTTSKAPRRKTRGTPPPTPA